jgi:hypothetical protein
VDAIASNKKILGHGTGAASQGVARELCLLYIIGTVSAPAGKGGGVTYYIISVSTSIEIVHHKLLEIDPCFFNQACT